MDNKSHHCNKNNAAPKIKTHEYYLRVGENVVIKKVHVKKIK